MPIWEDIKQVLLEIIGHGRGFTNIYVTKGTGIDTAVAEAVNRLCPAITITNQGATPIYWGYTKANQTLAAGGGSATLRWKNPVANQLVINDQGNTVRVEVWS